MQIVDKVINNEIDINQAIIELQEIATQVIKDNSHLLE
jgi:hypothetical protein